MSKKGVKIDNSQIHIVFNCKEDYRITIPILNHLPHKLYYFTAYIKSTNQKDENMEYFHLNTELLKEKMPNILIIQNEIDYTDYIEIIQGISKIIRAERKINPKSKIMINIGTGSNITALASTEAARLWKCDVYYVYSTKYTPTAEGPRHQGEMIIIYPPIFPIIKPQTNLIKVLKILHKTIQNKYSDKETVFPIKFIYKKEFIEILIEKGFLKLQKKHYDLRSRQSSYYMKVNKRFLEPLANQLGYIEISKDKRNKKIFITEKGKNILKIFRYLI